MVALTLTLPEGQLTLEYSAATNVGHKRSLNEDSVLAAPPVFLVADGMGGHANGDRASQTVVATFRSMLGTEDAPSAESVVATIVSANAAVIGQRDPENNALSGTTLAGLALVSTVANYRWMTFNVGDSRVYLWDGRRLQQITVDHSAVQELLDAGEITALDALNHPQRNVVTRAIGVFDDIDADVWLLPVSGRQTFIVCSDGLTKELADDQIAHLLASSRPGEVNLAEHLVEAALAAGGRDNVTVVVVESQLVGADMPDDDDTNDGGIPQSLESTRPRKQ